MLPMRIVGKFESVATLSLAGGGWRFLPNATFFAARTVESSALNHFVEVTSASVGLPRSAVPLRWVDENSLDRLLAGLFAGRHRARLQDGQLQGKSVADAGHVEGIGRTMGDGLQNTTPCLVESGVGRNTTRVLASDRAWISRGQLWSRLAGGLLVHVPQEWPGCFSATASHRRRSPYPDWRRVTLSPSPSSSCLLIPRHSLVGMPEALPVFGVPAAEL